MRKIIMIDGGAGRAIAAIPALEKYVQNHPDEEVYIIIAGWDNLLWGNPLLQDITFSMDTKGIFESYIKDADIVVSPEPYKQPSYFTQKKSLAEAFDEIINETNDHSDLMPPKLFFNKIEEKMAANVITDLRIKRDKDITLVLQPFGRGVMKDRNDIIDEGSRSINPDVYVKLAKKLHKEYNCIFFGEPDFVLDEDPSLKLQGDLRFWAAVIDAADYVVGCDSVAQHMARATNTPGTVVFGSTFPINTSYPDWFNTWENKKVEKVYNPIRMCGLDGHLADRHNDTIMDLDDDQIEEIYQSIVKDIKEKVGA